MDGEIVARKGGGGKGGKQERINAQFSEMPATECIGAGRLEGWFATPAHMAESRGWGHIQSYCFEGDLFFHLQRSPWLRGINFQKKDEVTFEVIEVNGRVEAVKLLLPSQVQDLEEKKLNGGEAVDPNLPSPNEFVGHRVSGFTKSHHLLVAHQSWGFVRSDLFSGQVFFHLTENPDMVDVEFDRDDVVEFLCASDEHRGGQVRAKNMVFISKSERPSIRGPHLSDSKKKKKEQWLKNWSATPPPDWVCKHCGWQNFGRNKKCSFNDRNNQNCPGERPPREEWPDTQNIKASEAAPEDASAQKALDQRRQAHLAWGKEEEVPEGWHSAADAGKSSGSWEPEKHKPIPVPVLGKEELPMFLEAGLPGAVAAVKLQEKKAAEEAALLMPLSAASGSGHDGYGYGGGCGGGYGGCGGGGIAAGAGGARVVPPPAGAAGSPDGNVQATLALCLGAFNDLAHSPASSQDGQMSALVTEVNQVLGDDRSAKHAFAMQLAKHPWIADNKFEVRYQPGKNVIVVARTPGAHAPQGGGSGAQVVQPPDAHQQQLLSHQDPSRKRPAEWAA